MIYMALKYKILVLNDSVSVFLQSYNEPAKGLKIKIVL